MYKEYNFRMLYHNKEEFVIIVQCGRSKSAQIRKEELQVVTLENADLYGNEK